MNDYLVKYCFNNGIIKYIIASGENQVDVLKKLSFDTFPDSVSCFVIGEVKNNTYAKTNINLLNIVSETLYTAKNSKHCNDTIILNLINNLKTEIINIIDEITI